MRVVKTTPQRTVVYHYDKQGRVTSETNTDGSLISDFVYANGKLVAKLAPLSVYFYHTDSTGTPLAMTDAGGSVVWRGDYLPFGEENLITATHENDYKFVGKEMDKETGLYYFGARYMEAMIGRFMSPDPVGAVEARTGKINQKKTNWGRPLTQDKEMRRLRFFTISRKLKCSKNDMAVSKLLSSILRRE